MTLFQTVSVEAFLASSSNCSLGLLPHMREEDFECTTFFLSCCLAATYWTLESPLLQGQQTWLTGRVLGHRIEMRCDSIPDPFREWFVEGTED